MAVGLNATVANALLNALCRATNYTAPTTVWAKLHTGDPGAAGTSNAATETTRKQLTFGSAAAGGAISNTVAASWSGVAATEDYTHASVWDASSGGNFLFSGTITAAAVQAGDDFTLPIGDIDASFAVAS